VQAYRELEVEGLVQMRQGAGTYVTDVTPERRARERAIDARRLVRDLLAEAARRGISAADLSLALSAELKEAAR
jgi:DNA-binding transcriptional regulator YhcF (GntR family)